MEEMYVAEPNGTSTTPTSSTSSTSSTSLPAAPPQAPPVPSIVANPLLAAFLAWLVPGAGHLFLKRGRRALLFFVLVLAALVIGCRLDGNLYVPVKDQPLTLLAT